ncbi:MAG TPA: heterodisulfide reductase subunit B [Deltaproteobacteria bacterium]|nr:heterodisulfide reductase subunit B [Deltaproteobacteria bacterium]
MTRVGYYPGCSLEGSAREYDESARAVCEALGVELVELEDWNCCGASAIPPPPKGKGLASRNLEIARRMGLEEMAVPCSACFLRLKEVKGDGVQIHHLLDFLSERTEEIAGKVKRPLQGLKAAAYYGCLIVRPPEVTGAEHPENPQGMERILEAIGAEVVPWAFKTDCCGGSVAMGRKDIGERLVGRIVGMAKRAGAEVLVTCCPLCQYNLEVYQVQKEPVPCLYFTEAIGLAMGLGALRWFKRHLINPEGVLREKGLLG